jgi:hypothetical protein
MSNRSLDVQEHIEAMRRDIDRMAQAVSRIAKEGRRAQAQMARTAARATKTARVSGSDAFEEALNLGSDIGKASAGILGKGIEFARQRLGSPLGVLLVLSGIGLLSRRLFRR